MTALEFLKKKSQTPEKILKNQLSDFLSEYFIVFKEQTSTDKRSRIDLILVHKSDKEQQYLFGIEIKISNKKKGKNISDWFKQAVRYTNCKFFDNKDILVFTFPQISGIYFEEGVLMSKHDVFAHDYMGAHHNVSTFLGCNGIGELQVYDYWDNEKRKDQIGLRLVHTSKIIWDSKRNYLNVKYCNKYFPKYNGY